MKYLLFLGNPALIIQAQQGPPAHGEVLAVVDMMVEAGAEEV